MTVGSIDGLTCLAQVVTSTRTRTSAVSENSLGSCLFSTLLTSVSPSCVVNL